MRYRPGYLLKLLRDESIPQVVNRIKNRTIHFIRRAIRTVSSSEKGFKDEAEDRLDISNTPESVREKIDIHFRALRDYRPKLY